MKDTFKLICPVCSKRLYPSGNSLICDKKHSYDIARQGYVNLLPVQNKKSLAPGDSKDMLAARRSFLNTGKYRPVCDNVIRAVNRYKPCDAPVLVDVGSGEGYYTSHLQNACGADCIGIDIAKDAAKMACSRSKDILWLVATASHLPVESGSADVVCALFSLFLPQEYARILRRGGCAAEVSAGTEHLIELKRIIYDDVFEQHKHPAPCGDAFEEAECSEYRFGITLNREELHDLLLMTPHTRRINAAQRQRLEALDSLALTVHYWLRVMIKK